MAGSLIRRVSALNQVGYGVNIWEIAPPRNVEGEAQNVIGMVAELPWGPPSVVTKVTTPAEFWEAFYPAAFGADKAEATYRAILALLNKPIFTRGGLKVVRVDATSAAAATKSDAAGTGTVEITAKYKGETGNTIKRQWTAATDGDGAKRNLVITIGTSYSATYENLSTTTVTAVADAYVTVTKSSPSAMPTAGSAELLTGGSDGTAVATDYTGSDSVQKGLRCFYGDSVQVDVLFVAECPSGLINAVNGALKAFATACEKGIAVLCTVDGQTSADALSYVASYTADRCVYTWPRVKTTNFFDEDAGEIEVDGNAFAAAAIANVDAWLSPGGAGGAEYLTGITGLEDETASRTTLDGLSDGGIVPWFMSSAFGGAILYRAKTTATDGTRVFSRRMRDYLENAIATYAEHYVETQLDVDLGSRVYGPNTSGFISAVMQFLENEKISTHLKGYSVDGFSENTEAGLDGGRWIVLIKAELYPMAEEIVIKAQIGETVVIS
jgi:hypothetical protein